MEAPQNDPLATKDMTKLMQSISPLVTSTFHYFLLFFFPFVQVL